MQVNTAEYLQKLNADEFLQHCKELKIYIKEEDSKYLTERWDEVERFRNDLVASLISATERRENIILNRQSKIMEALSTCEVPARYINATLFDFKDKKLLSQIEPFLNGESEGLFFHGSAGTGKTHLAIAIMREKILRHKNDILFDTGKFRVKSTPLPLFKSINDLLLEIRTSFKEGPETTEESLIDKYTQKVYQESWQCDKIERMFLFFDDIGAEKTTDWVLQTLYTIIDRRYSNMEKTIFTSNLSLEQIAHKLGDRIASRIAGMGKIIEIQGKDRRI